MAEGRGGSRWTEVIELADEIDTADHRASGDGMGNLKIQEACGRLREIARSVPVGEPDASQKTINGLLDAVERLNGQKDALRRENGQLRELLDLPVGERVAAVAELVGEPDDELVERVVEAAELIEKVAEAMFDRAHPGAGWEDEKPIKGGMSQAPFYRGLAEAAVAAVRAAGTARNDG